MSSGASKQTLDEPDGQVHDQLMTSTATKIRLTANQAMAICLANENDEADTPNAAAILDRLYSAAETDQTITIDTDSAWSVVAHLDIDSDDWSGRMLRALTTAVEKIEATR